MSLRRPFAHFAALLVAVAVVLGAGGVAFATPDGYTVRADPAGDRLVRIDLDSGSATPASDALTGITGVQDLALGDDALYGVSVDKGLLVSIDPSDGGLRSSVPLSVAVSAAGITFTADGTLWMTATVQDLGVRLYTVNPATGHVTDKGLLGTPGAPDISGLVTTCDDEILGVAGATQIVQVDRDPPTVQPFFPAFSSGPQSLGLDPATATVWGLQASGSSDPGRIWHVDAITGNLTDTGETTIAGTIRGLTIAELPCGGTVQTAAPPEPLLLAPNFTG